MKCPRNSLLPILGALLATGVLAGAGPAQNGVTGRAGNFSAQLVEEFLRALSVQGGMNLHAEILYGRDVHHQIEALFKALAKALQEAVSRDPRVKGVPSTKGRI